MNPISSVATRGSLISSAPYLLGWGRDHGCSVATHSKVRFVLCRRHFSLRIPV